MRYGYARVSTREQDEARQIKALKNNDASCPVCGSPIEEEFQSLEDLVEKTKNKKEHFKNIEVEIVSLTSKLNEEKNNLNIYNQNLVFKKEKEEALLLYKEKEKELKNYMKSSNFDSIDIITQKINLLEKRVEDINYQIDILIDSQKFKENENKISEIRIEYSQIKYNLDKLYFQK